MIDSVYQIDPDEIVITLYSKEALAVVCYRLILGLKFNRASNYSV
mgnify:CR=1 FL=1|jgi:hypothetical protein